MLELELEPDLLTRSLSPIENLSINTVSKKTLKKKDLLGLVFPLGSSGLLPFLLPFLLSLLSPSLALSLLLKSAPLPAAIRLPELVLADRGRPVGELSIFWDFIKSADLSLVLQY